MHCCYAIKACNSRELDGRLEAKNEQGELSRVLAGPARKNRRSAVEAGSAGGLSAGHLVSRDQLERLVGFGFCSGGGCWADS